MFSLVLTFMKEGHGGIFEFSKRRYGKFSDYFYINAKQPSLKPAVSEWFTHLESSASGEPYSQVMSESIDFLLNDVLLPQRVRRLGESQIEAQLQEI